MGSKPEVDGEYVFRGQNVKVTELRKLGRGWRVQYQTIAGGLSFYCRLRDWQKGVQ